MSYKAYGNMPCGNPRCLMTRRPGEVFCPEDYHKLPKAIRTKLWNATYSVVLEGITEGKKFLEDLYQLQLSKKGE